MKFSILVKSTVMAMLLAAAGQAMAAKPDYISGIPNHLDEASFSDRIQARAGGSLSPGGRAFSVQWMAASTIITASHHATFGESESGPLKSGFYVPGIGEGRQWALLGAGLMLLGMLARHKTMSQN